MPIKTFTAFSLMLLLSGLGGYLGYWWTIVPACFIPAFLFIRSQKLAFITGSSALTLLWGVFLYMSSLFHSQATLQQMAKIFSLSVAVFVTVNVLLGSLLGGFAAYCGALTRSCIHVRQKER